MVIAVDEGAPPRSGAISALLLTLECRLFFCEQQMRLGLLPVAGVCSPSCSTATKSQMHAPSALPATLAPMHFLAPHRQRSPRGACGLQADKDLDVVVQH